MKDILKNQASHKLNTLAELADKMGTILSEDGEHDEYLCPECGDIFNISIYKVTFMEHSSWRQMQSSQENNEVVTKIQELVAVENK